MINAWAYLPSLGSGVPFLLFSPAAPAAGTEKTRRGLFLLLPTDTTSPPAAAAAAGPATQKHHIHHFCASLSTVTDHLMVNKVQLRSLVLLGISCTHWILTGVNVLFVCLC